MQGESELDAPAEDAGEEEEESQGALPLALALVPATATEELPPQSLILLMRLLRTEFEAHSTAGLPG